jgi:hypothetical protein
VPLRFASRKLAASRLGHAEFLELLLQDELNVRKDRQLERRKLAAGFRALQPLDQFDGSFSPSIDRETIFIPSSIPVARGRSSDSHLKHQK